MSDPQHEDEDFAKARRGRNIALGLALAVFVILIFGVSLIQMMRGAPAGHF
jgi:hypothetical protein